MEEAESLEAFYKRKFDWIPKTLRQEIGHFNLFRLQPFENGKIRPVPYRRRDFYKVMLCVGDVEFHYANKVLAIKQQALVFSNPQIPYKCEYLERVKGGFYCIFNQHFFRQFGDINKYTVFHPNGNHVFELTDEQTQTVSQIYKKMFEEFNSNYIHKYDVIRNLVFELLHFALKTQPTSQLNHQPINASQRIASLFFELLERQFPIDENHTEINLRSPSDFANQLNIHVNHLNKALKESIQKSTSQIIAERILEEAKNLLSNTYMNVSEIAHALGFTEATHFNNFFKKHTQLSPSQFRKL